ncbi:MAG: hypothetical protein JO235_26325 [Chroococcidiopsidaceae cyanobacterium CP_BM_RX_35]|nr:hypothetical protein [Chroococcidiopsidaceae cyanobacterium CP_BM_RX_35]
MTYVENTKKVSEGLSRLGRLNPDWLWQFAQAESKADMFKKLRGGFLLIVGYLLSPLCWWNDLFFNLPIAYLFGYICSLFSPSFLLPGSVIGYWLSNIAGILLMQLGAVDVLQRPKERNLKKDLLFGLASSTIYTLVILALVQFKIINPPIL